MDVNALTAALSRHMPAVLRWSGALARQLRQAQYRRLGQELGKCRHGRLDARRPERAGVDRRPLSAISIRNFASCRIEAEETTGDLARFSKDGDFVLAIDPIDGTKQYRDRTGNGYSVMLHLRNRETVLYSLVYIPESGPEGTWVEVRDGQVFCGPDDPTRPAADVLRAMTAVECADFARFKENLS